jgi:PleD family two-component response regulator
MLAPTRARSTESKFRILCLGSDAGSISVLRQVLTEPDYRLVTCSERESAILFLRSEIPYHLLLIDLEWRGMEGLKLARLARSLRHRKRMPIILVAATEFSGELQALARKAGVSDCVMKTPDMGGVGEAVRRMIDAR